MRKYSDIDERNIRVDRLVREWTRSGLIGQDVQLKVAPELKVELRRTNLFLRLILFAFGLVIICALVMLIGVTLDLQGEEAIALLCFSAAIGCFVLSEFLLNRFRFYRFGIEEAAASGSVLLLVMSAILLTLSIRSSRTYDLPVLAGLMAGAFGSFGIYLRFGYIYAAIAATLCMGLVPFYVGVPPVGERIAAALMLMIVFVVARHKHGEWGDEFPGDEYGVIQATSWAAVYAILNLELAPSVPFIPSALVPPSFHWLTYTVIWVMPVVGMYLAIRAKDRWFLDTNLVLVICTLITNKAYLGLARQTWDPIVFGVVLASAAVLLRRWLSHSEPDGFTPVRLLSSENRALSVVGTAAAALPIVSRLPAESPSNDAFQAGGGRSGGAGASGSF